MVLRGGFAHADIDHYVTLFHKGTTGAQLLPRCLFLFVVYLGFVRKNRSALELAAVLSHAIGMVFLLWSRYQYISFLRVETKVFKYSFQALIVEQTCGVLK